MLVTYTCKNYIDPIITNYVNNCEKYCVSNITLIFYTNNQGYK